MPQIFLVAQELIIVGEPITLYGDSPLGRFSTVFEDEGNTGYFYALDDEKTDNQVCDALHIYNVKRVADAHIPSKIEIIWSEDGLKSALLINDQPHAVFDFAEQRGCCRTNFPPPNKNWTDYEHKWTDKALDFFK